MLCGDFGHKAKALSGRDFKFNRRVRWHRWGDDSSWENDELELCAIKVKVHEAFGAVSVSNSGGPWIGLFEGQVISITVTGESGG